MIVVDTSVLLAILFDEPDGSAFEAFLEKARDDRGVPTPALVECQMVLAKRYDDPSAAIVGLLDALLVKPIAFTDVHAYEANTGFRRYGKGRHPAALNFGDCLVYGAAKSLNAPLLFKGDDFRLTDIVPAL